MQHFSFGVGRIVQVHKLRCALHGNLHVELGLVWVRIRDRVGLGLGLELQIGLGLGLAKDRVSATQCSAIYKYM